MERNQREEDRLSLLPEGIFLHILSLIYDTKFAIQTCLLLSKRFANLWAFLPDFILDSSRFRNEISFHNFVVSVLQKSQLSKINSITFTRQCESHDRSLLEQVIIFGLLRQVEHFTLTLDYFSKHGGYLQHLYTYNSLTTLSLSHRISFDRPLLLAQLTSLRLRYFVLGESDFFSGCPNLKDLTLIKCILLSSSDDRMPVLNVTAPHLSQLVVADCNRGGQGGEFRVVLRAPRLEVLRISYFGHPPLVQSDKLNLLHTAEVDYTYTYTFNEGLHEREWYNKMSLNVIPLLQCFPNAESISLSFWTIKLLTKVRKNLAKEPSPFDKLRYLSIISSKSSSFSTCVKDFLLKNSPDAKVNWREKSKVQEYL